jgi:Phosphoenolpyruvate-protein kinase (PTS system EI component in bacteria)
VKPGTIRTHSARKGAATYAASGCTVSASTMSAICNRDGWKLGGTRNKYIKYEAAGDQFLGRTLCGLNSLTKEFSMSPPLFNMVEKELNELDRLLIPFVPDGSSITAVPTFEVLQICFACVVYHKKFLCGHLHTSNCFCSHPAMCHLPNVSVCGLILFFSSSCSMIMTIVAQCCMVKPMHVHYVHN